MKINSCTKIAGALLLVVIGAVPCAAGAAAAAGPPTRPLPPNARIVFLHHSTGECIWNGGVAGWFARYNAANKTAYRITQRNFPKDSPYGWENYPYDYWNIWVRHAGAKPFKAEPTLEILTRQYDVIIFKHCFPVSNIEPDTGRGDVASGDKRTENYKLQYLALKKKLRQFPKTRFILWTGAAQVRSNTDAAAARRAGAFFDWVRKRWDEKGDNIYIWDFYRLETDGGLYLKPDYAQARTDSHPNEKFSKAVAPYFCRRIVDVITGRGDLANITGNGKGRKAPVAAAAPAAPVAPKKPTAPKKPAAAKTPRPDEEIAAVGPGKWLFDDAENPKVRERRWPAAARYAVDGDNHVVMINFAAGVEQDWGEYGKHMVVRTRPPAKNHRLAGFRYLALRMKADRKMDVVLGLVTLPDPRGREDQPYFAFNAYLHPQPGVWKWIVLDLAKLELEVEGPSAYARAGSPPRPMHLTCLRFCAHKKNEKAVFAVDDVMFLRDLPGHLKPHLQSP